MKKTFQYIFFGWMAFWFILGFLLIFPFVWLIIQRKQWHKYYFYFSKAWGYLFYTMCFLPVKTVWHFKPEKKQVYIYCPNHFAYLDIALLTRTMPAFFIFVGLFDLSKIPLFGYMFRKIHIPINRGSLKNKYQTYQRCKDALDEGKNLLIFPEGGIWTTDFPKLSPFKEGAFRMAIEKQVPIVPVTIPYNWKLMPLFDISRLKWHKSEVIFHQPIETKGLTLKDINQLKEQVFAVIETQIRKSNA